MSYSRRQLYAMGEPLGDGATRREVGGKIIYGSGGSDGGQPEKQTTIVDIPEWAKPYAKESLGKAAALSATPYQAYGGERIAQFSPLQKQAFGQAGQQQVAGQIGTGTGLASLAGASSFNDPGTASSFMSPYMDAVVQQQMESAQRQADIASTQRGAQAVRAGAFGGSRQAIENAEAARALASQKGQIQATGLQSAFERGQSQFNQEQATRLNAAGQLGQLGQQQFGQQMDITGQQAQFGGQQRAATQDVLGAQYQDFLNQQRAPYDQLAFMTSMIRGTPMGQTTTMYAPPPSQTSQLIGLGTAAAGAYGAYNKAAGGEVHSYAEGGGISALNQPQMAAMADGMSDQQLGQTAQMPSITELAKMTLAAEAQQRAQMRQQAAGQQAMAQQQPQGTVAEEQLAAIGGLSDLSAPNLEGMGEGMAGGGIVAFQTGGDTSPFGRFVDRTSAAFSESSEANKLRNKLQMQYGPASAVPGLFYKQSDAERAEAQRIVELLPKLSLSQLKELEAGAGAKAATSAAPVATQTPAAPAGIAPRVDLRKGMADPRTGLEGLTPAKAKAEQAVAKAAPAPTAEKTGAAPVGLSALKAQTTSGMDDLKGQLEGINAARTAAAANQVERAKAQEAEMGEYGVEEGKRLKAREEGLKGAEDKNFNMALIEAGLAMMSGTSANAFENIGKGALVGTKAYTAGIERIQSRKEKLDDALTALENAKRSDKRVSQERMDRLEANVDNAKTANAEALYQFGSKQLDMTREDARLATELASRERVASIGAAGRSEAKPFNYQDAYADYLKANAGKTDPVGKPIPVMSYADYIRQFALPQMAGTGTTSTLPKGAAVLPRN